MALNTLELWQQQLVVHQAALDASMTDLTAAQAMQKSAAAALAADLRDLDKAGADIAAQRARLSATAVPADAGALIVEITAAVIGQHGLQGRVIAGQVAVADSGAQIDAATSALNRATRRVAAAKAAIAAATTDQQQRSALKSAIAAPPLATVAADAAALLAGPSASHAASRLALNFPAPMLAIAQLRHDLWVGEVDGLRASADAARGAQAAGALADDGLAGAVEQTASALQAAQAALAEPVATAAARFARADAVLQKLEAIELAAPGAVADILSDAEKAQIAALGTAGGAAAEPAAAAIAPLQQAVFDAQAAVAAQVLSQIGTDVDQLAGDATVAARRAAVTSAQSALGTALTGFAATADKLALDHWQIVVPDPAWAVLIDYQEGLAALNALSTVDLPALAAAMDAAETAYTTALAAAEKARRRAEARADAAALSQARLDAARAAIANRLPSAVRGDIF
jgi:hypothetical protein